MSNPTLKSTIAALVMMVFLSVMGATVAAATAADSADAETIVPIGAFERVDFFSWSNYPLRFLLTTVAVVAFHNIGLPHRRSERIVESVRHEGSL